MRPSEIDPAKSSAQTDQIVVEEPAQQLQSSEVAKYLKANPEFFLQHTGLLAELVLPHQSGKTISLVEHQVAILRDRNVDMRKRMNELVANARDNEELFRKTRLLTMSLLDAKNVQELNEVLATHVLVDFEADFVCCHLPAAGESFDHIRQHGKALPFMSLLASSSATLTTLRKDELTQIFPQIEHDSSGSAALIPLNFSSTEASSTTAQSKGTAAIPGSSGALAIGCRDPHRFSNDMDTLFVSYIAEVLACALAKFGLGINHQTDQA